MVKIKVKEDVPSFPMVPFTHHECSEDHDRLLAVVMYSGSKSWGRVGFGVYFSGSGRVRGSKFRGRPPRVSGFSRVFKLKSRVGVGLGSTFRGRVGVGDHNVGVVPLGFRGFGSPTTSLARAFCFLGFWASGGFG